MKLKYKFSDLLEEISEHNSELQYGLNDIVGVTIEKQMIPTIANLKQTALDKFYIVRPGTFVYNPRTHGVRLGIGYNQTNSTYITSWNNFAFKVKDSVLNILNPDYLWMYFMRTEWDRETNFRAWGSSTIVFSWSIFKNMTIELPSKSTQDRLALQFKVISDRIKLKKKINDNLEDTIQALFNKMYFDSNLHLPETIIKQNSVPDAWISTKVSEYASVQTGPFGSQLHNEDYVSTGTPIITVEHMKGKYITHRNLPLVSDKDCTRLNKYNLQPGDIVFSRVGSVDRAVLVTKSEDGWLFSGRCLRVRPFESAIGIYLLWWFNQPVIRQLIISSAVGATMPSINTDILSNIRLILPPKQKLESFCNTSEHIINSITDNLTEIRKLEELQLNIQSSLSR